MRCYKRLLAAMTGLCILGGIASAVPAQAEPLSAESYDFNGDGDVGLADAVSLFKYLHMKEKPVYIAKADLNHDKQVDVYDLGLFIRLLVHETDITEEEIHAVLLSEQYKGAAVKAVTVDADTVLGQTKFALELIQHSAEAGKNVLVSPYSVSQALGMTANGANGDTLAEMENVLGGDIGTLNAAFYSLRTSAPDTEDAKLSTANSIWVRDGYPVKPDFLQKNADYYAADAYAAPFDQTTLKDINNWVDIKTDHMVPNILDRIPEQAMMYLVNAVAFDAKWERPYEENNVRKSKFKAADGSGQEAEMLCRTLYLYLSDKNASGFLQYYKGGEYAFAALLPKNGMTPEKYLAGLTPEGLHEMLANPEETPVITELPEFSYDFDTLLNDSLADMGMPTAFSPMADFYGMTDDPDGLFISRVIHKTHIELTPVGTRAGAATVVEMTKNSAPMLEDAKEVILDRPFVYMIVDTKTTLPVFIGTVNSLKNS